VVTGGTFPHCLLAFATRDRLKDVFGRAASDRASHKHKRKISIDKRFLLDELFWEGAIKIKVPEPKVDFSKNLGGVACISNLLFCKILRSYAEAYRKRYT
jgi:hypothetical protein